MRGIQNRATVQAITCTIEPNASLIMLPGPVQCFAQSAYDQMQRFILKCPTSSNLVLLDSVTSGRASRGEVYHFDRYYSLNEVWSIQTDKRIIRDALLLEKPELTLQKMVYDTYATLILCGPRTRPIIQHFQAAQETVLQLKTLPDLFWSISVLEINVAIVKVAGFSPEAVKLFLQEQTKAGGLEQWLGMDVFKQGWA